MAYRQEIRERFNRCWIVQQGFKGTERGISDLLFRLILDGLVGYHGISTTKECVLSFNPPQKTLPHPPPVETPLLDIVQYGISPFRQAPMEGAFKHWLFQGAHRLSQRAPYFIVPVGIGECMDLVSWWEGVTGVLTDVSRGCPLAWELYPVNG